MTLTVCVKVYRTKFEIENYIDEDYILALVKSGSFKLTCNNEECVVGSGEATIFHPDVSYHREVIEPVTIYLFRFKTQKQIPREMKIQFEDTGRIQSTLNLLNKLDTRIYPNDFAYRKAIFFDIMTQHFIESSCNPEEGAPKDPLMQRATHIIKQKLHHKIVLPEIADYLGISYVHFIRRFKKFTGFTPTEYIAQMRMQRAIDFLTNTNMSIKEIAPKCGFENEYYFSNFFKQHKGTSPANYRKNFIVL